ncbi:MAG: nicotinamide-nucleotide adenylyltransferase [Thermoplasmatota archaeon]
MRGLFIGRFQPLHKGHLSIIEHALLEVDELVIGIGSAEKSYLPDDPFTAGERIDMILAVVREEGWEGKVIPVSIRDINRYSIWVEHVVSLCPRFDLVYSNNPLTRTLFRKAGYEVRDTPIIDRSKLSGRQIRKRMSEGGYWETLLPAAVSKKIIEIGGVERIREIFGPGDSE